MNITDLPTTRIEAKQNRSRHYYTGLPCKYGHITHRLTSSSQCGECVRLAHYKDYAKHRTARLQGICDWQKKNKSSVNAASSKWRENNSQQEKRTRTTWYQKNKKRILKQNKQWREKNPGLLRLYNTQRRAQLVLATPK